MKRILALSPVPEGGAGYRLRIAQYAPYLREAGYELTIEPLYDPATFDIMYQPGHYAAKAAGLAHGTAARARAVRNASAYAAAWVYREAHPLGPAVFERAIARRGVPLVFDFDDAIYLPNSSQPNRLVRRLKRPGKTAEIIGLSDHVIAGSGYLAAYARRYSSAVTVVPTVVDTEVWRPHAPGPDRDRVPVIGWIGTPTTTPYLLSLAETFAGLARSHSFVLRISGAAQPVRIPGVRVENVPWSLDREVELFATCDIGVYPLPDDDWARGKCGLKAIQFMACSVPVVASAVGVNPEVIRHGESGFLASDRAEWLSRLSTLLESAQLRQRLGASGRIRVEERYSLHSSAPTLVRVFDQVADRSARS